MNYGDVRNYFLQVLNRPKDPTVTTTLVNMWLQQAIIRIQKLLDCPANGTIVDYTPEVATGSFAIPPDYLRLDRLLVNGRVLEQRAANTVLPMSQLPGIPRYYCIHGGYFYIAPQAAAGSTIELFYQADFSPLVLDSDSNWLTTNASQQVVDAAMVLACRFYQLPSLQLYEDAFTQAIGDINAEAQAGLLRNARMSSGIDFAVGGDFTRRAYSFGPSI